MDIIQPNRNRNLSSFDEISSAQDQRLLTEQEDKPRYQKLDVVDKVLILGIFATIPRSISEFKFWERDREYLMGNNCHNPNAHSYIIDEKETTRLTWSFDKHTNICQKFTLFDDWEDHPPFTTSEILLTTFAVKKSVEYIVRKVHNCIKNKFR